MKKAPRGCGAAGVGNVLVLYKKSAYQEYFQEYKSPALSRCFRAGDLHLAHFKKSHQVHYRTLDVVRRLLKERGVRHSVQARGAKVDKSRFDLIVAVGGDGTVLEAAKGVRRPLILGVNSDPNHSVGMFCAADRKTIAAKMDDVLTGKAILKKLCRLSLKLNGKQLGIDALNDVLIAHANPAAMSHYVIGLGERREQQRSSGVWIATPAGSTGAICSAGGRRMDIQAKRFQYLARELYAARRHVYRLPGGLVPSGKSLWLRSLMQEGMIYVDGAHRHYLFSYGAVLAISLSSDPVQLVR